MDGSGYKDPAKLKAALELAQSFKTSSKDSKSRGNGGANKNFKRESSFTEVPRPQHAQPNPGTRLTTAQEVRPQPLMPSNIPPPSQRNYTGNVLISSPSKIGSGPILGNKAADFLRRRDGATKPAVPLTSQVSENDISSIKGSSITPRLHEATPIQPTDSKPDASRSVPSNQEPEKGPSKPPTTSGTDLTVSQSSPSAEGLAEVVTSSNMTEAQSSRPDNGLKATSTENILDTLFSFLDQALDTVAKGPSSNTSPAASITANTLPIEVSVQPAQKPAEISHSSLSPETGEVTAEVTPLGNQVEEDTSQIELHEDEKLPLKEEELVPEQPPSMASDSGNEEPSPTRHENSKLSADAPEWTPEQQSNGRNLLTQYSEYMKPTGQSSGHIVSVTPVQFANGFLVPGPSTGQLWLQTPVEVSTDAIPSHAIPSDAITPSVIDLGQLATFPLDILPNSLVSATPIASSSAVAGPRKPTKGLKASMWAT
ncbi:hypothetical protein AK830_g3491 [Neonectria ditissima]|uniref:Uncharacterized protein n=1 Tax=Neonectria ditissima TaxID=78410 RepID=A0A0N8H7Y8_9HYPO|nr:hypothetical protein AK830_g3491 [Neonectria ditissima]